MKQYHDLLQHVRDNGHRKRDRTGTGALSCQLYQRAHQLAQLPTEFELHLVHHGDGSKFLRVIPK